MNPVVLTIFSLFLYGNNFAREYVTPMKPGATDAKMINTRTQAQHSNSIIGVWLTAEKDGKVEIFLSGDKYYGKLIWGKKLYEEDGKTLKKDVKNNEVKLRDRPLLNMVMLSDFVYRDGEWTDGKIYDPRSGKTYSSTLKLKNGDLEVRGYIGLPAFGKSTVWTRSSK